MEDVGYKTKKLNEQGIFQFVENKIKFFIRTTEILNEIFENFYIKIQ